MDRRQVLVGMTAMGVAGSLNLDNLLNAQCTEPASKSTIPTASIRSRTSLTASSVHCSVPSRCALKRVHPSLKQGYGPLNSAPTGSCSRFVWGRTGILGRYILVQTTSTPKCVIPKAGY